MALTTEEQKFYDFAKAALPPWMPENDEFLLGCAKMFGSVKTLIDYLFGQALISTATGATATTPDWLNQHAVDRGTRRQLDESDEALRARLRSVPEALTRESLLEACNAILAANGLPETAAMVELPRDAAHAGTYVAFGDTSLGGTFAAGAGTTMVFTPVEAFARPPYRDASVVRRVQSFVLNVDATDAGNDGSFPVSGISGNGAAFDNAAGVPGVDAGANWSVGKRDRRDNDLDGFSRAFASRGFRARGSRPTIVIMLPHGTTAGIVASVREMLRQKKAAGIRAIVERRLNP